MFENFMLNTKCHTNSENDCEPYNKQFIDLACSVCTVKYRTLVLFSTDLARSVRTNYKKPQSDISRYRSHARSIIL